MKANILKIMFVGVVALFAVGVQADGGCNFYRDLGQGSRGEDVRCLQQYLSTQGYSTYIFPDGSFGPITRQAVMSWQSSNGIFPASGYFDVISRNKYFEVVSYGGMTVVGDVLGVSTSYFSPQEQVARQKIQRALIAIEDARHEDDDSESFEDAEDNILISVRAFFVERNFSKASEFADDAFNDAQDVLDENDSGDREDAEDLIDEVNDDIDDAQDVIDDAEDDGEDVDEANDLLDEARDVLDDAEDEFDDKDYDEAEELAEEAADLVDEALDEIDENNTNNPQAAFNAIEDAQDAIDDAEDEIDDADDDGEDVDDAEDLLEEAEETLEDARDEYNSGDYDEAKDLAEEAEELAEDAVDELD